MREVFVSGVGMTRFGKFFERSLKSLTREAVTCALSDAGTTSDKIEYAVFSNAIGGVITGQEMVAGQVCLAPLGVRGIPVINVENACASGSTALSLAYQAVAAGVVDVALAVGVEKMVHPEKRVSYDAISRAADVEDVERRRQQNLIVASYFMDLYAGSARKAIDSGEVSVRDFAKVAVKNQLHGMANPRAQYGGTYTEEDILDSPLVVDPLHLLMCSPISDGAAAVILEAGDRVLGQTERPRVRILASQVASGGRPSAGEDRAVRTAAIKAYDQASLGPADIHVMELHDATASAEIELYEQLGFAEAGEGARLIRDGTTSMSGHVPTNTSGGLLAKGHPIGATGVAQMCELTWQLRGEAGDRQVSGAGIGLAQNGGGWVGEDNAAAAVHIVAVR